MDRGYIQVYYGDGKGKTTAAVGQAVRAAGAGLTVCFAQFLKPGTSCELEGLRALGVRMISGAQDKFCFQMTPEEKEQARLRNEAVLSEALLLEDDMLVLDEAMDACRLGLLDRNRVLALLREKPQGMELVITGHEPDPAIVDAADYVTEAVCHKHPFQEGAPARRGIEY
ncbi:MAG TPA: cob(I)yrinic acid a,c-diamide adenosyltransferase [Candidatus Aphodovivens excrementavium]|nr:cob(I)yrinic acid a,c-diamide adenosyltransferase [Candidatus Aphodovivens excrementavium]